MDRRGFLVACGGAGLLAEAGLAVGAPVPLAAPALSGGPFALDHAGLHLDFEIFEGRLRQRALAPAGFVPPRALPPADVASGADVALHVTGEDVDDHHGLKLTGGLPGQRLVYVGRRLEARSLGPQHVLVQESAAHGLLVESFYEMVDGVPVIRRRTRLTNRGPRPLGIEWLSSATLHHFAHLAPSPPEERLRIHFCHNSWQAEGQWRAFSPSRLGLVENGEFSLSGAFFTNVGTWSTMRYLPMGMIEDRELHLTWFWQIEHNGAWHFEVSNSSDKSWYLYLGGPDAPHHQAWKRLAPGETSESVPVAVGCVRGGFDEAVAALTAYRRAACRRPHPSYRKAPVVFNDYMNCLFGDPTTEKERPLIEAAAAAGCEYYVIDAGWYARRNENWWPTVGLWEPSPDRFPDGIAALLGEIRARGLVPGLWLEIEVAGVDSPLEDRPDSWFFVRHGRRVVDHGRFLLDFRNPEVRAHADSVVDRLVREYGVGYIKMDYNVTGGVGTETDADSAGQGALEHERALLAWLDAVGARYPELVIENCASGGGRMDYAMLSRLQIQSSTDQTDYRRYPAILVGAMAGVLPEQLAAWSYPKADGDADEASFNMVTALLCRIHQSGHLARLPPASLAQVKAALRVYKQHIRDGLARATPFFPLGMPDLTDPCSPVALGLAQPDQTLIGVWRLAGPDPAVVVSTPGADGAASVLFPTDLGISLERRGGALVLSFPRPHMAAIVRVAESP
jgi:alpha-galactosidase